MEIGKFKLAKADLVRPPRKPIQEQIIPQEKPYTKEVFQVEVEPFIKGFIGGFPKNEMTMKLQSILDKAVERGALSVDEGTTYMRDRKQQLLDFVKQNPGQTLPELTRENFAFGTEKPITPNNDLGNIQVADLKDDLTPGPLKDELDGKYDPSQETHEDYLKRINLERPFNASLEESTMGPGGYPMTAGNILNVPKAAKTAMNLIEKGQVGIRDAVKITKDFLNRRDSYTPTGIAGDKKDYTKEKDFLQVFNKLKNKFFQGDVTKTNRSLGVYDRFAKDIEQRVIKAEKGTGVTGQDDRFLFYEPSVPEPVKGMSWPDTTTLMKRNPDKFLSLKVDKGDPNRFLDKKSLANYLGIKFEKDDLGKLTRYGKTQSDAFMTRLTNLGVKTTKQGLFDTNDVINKLVKVSEKKLVEGDRKSLRGAGRYGLEKKFDPELFSERERVKRIVKKNSQGLDFYIPRGVDDLGHPYSITNSENKYKKLFKDSNMNRLNTLVYQDPLINVELFKTSGYESKHDKMFDILSKIQNKKVTPEIQNQLLKIKKDMNDNYNYVKNIIKNPKELIKYLPENTDPKYVNYLSKSHVDRVQKIDINIPKVGETFKSKDVFVDMSTVNPKYIVGYVNNINPNAKKFKDLSLAEQELYRKNLLIQNSEIVSDFIKKAGATSDEAEEIREAITMSKGGRVEFNEGKLAKIGNVAGNVVGKAFAGLDVPLVQGLFATGYEAGADPLQYTIPAGFTDAVNRYLNLYEKSPGKAKNFIKSVLRLMPIEQAQKFYPIFSKLGKVGSTTGYPFLKAASEALKEIKVRKETERAAADFKMSPQKMKELRSLSLKKENLPRLQDDAYVPTEQDYSEANEKIQKARDAFALQTKILGSFFGLTEDPLAEKESIYTRGKQVPMSLERVQEGSRASFEDGTDPKKPKGLGSLSKRNFLKTLALIPAGIMAIRGGPNLLKKAAATKKAIAAKGMPEWFSTLVDKVIETGADVTKQFAKEKGEQVFVKQLGEAEGVRVTKNLETGKVTVDYDSPTNMGEDTVTFTYRPGTKTEKGENIPAQFEASELEPRGIRMGPDDYDIEFNGEHLVEDINFLESDTSSLKQFATGKLDKKDLKLREEKVKRVENINNDQVAQAEYLETKYGPSADDFNDYDLNYQDYSDYD